MFFKTQGTEVAMAPGMVRRTLGSTDKLTLIEIRFARGAGSRGNLHSHPHDQVGLVASGRVILQVQDEKVELSAGDGYTVAGGIPHGVFEALEESVLIECFSPAREEYR